MEINKNDKTILFSIMAITGMTFSPIGEELFFRGIVHASFAKSIGGKKASIVDGSAFAITHISHFGLVFPENLGVENAINPGQLKYQINTVPFATSYLHEYATNEMLTKDNWQYVANSKTTCIIADLQPGVTYHCRVAATGRRGQLLYSDIVSRIVA